MALEDVPVSYTQTQGHKTTLLPIITHLNINVPSGKYVPQYSGKSLYSLIWDFFGILRQFQI